MRDNMQSDADLTAKFVELLTRHQLGLLRYIAALVPNMDDAEDLLQEASKIMWEHFASFDCDTDFMIWAKKIALLRVLEYRRRSHRQVATLPSELLEQISEKWGREFAGNGSSERYDALRTCLEDLRPVDRELIQMRYRQGLKVMDIATGLNRPENSVTKSLVRIRHTLMECIYRRMRALNGE